MKKTLWLLGVLFFPAAAGAQVKIDSVQLLHDVKALSADSMQGRKSCTAGSQKARQYILAAFKKNRLQAFDGDFRQFFSYSHRGERCDTAANLIGYFPGASPDAIVLSAHYDHLGIHNGKIFPGADDNASGVAALLAVMAYFSRNRPRHTLVFAAFDAEESGLHGAKAFVNNLPLDKKNVVLNVNLDMVSRNDKNELYAAGCRHYPFLKPYLEKTAKTSAVKLLFGHDSGNSSDNWTDASDHAPFHRAGIPFIYFGVEDHQDYHQPTDVFARIQPKFFVNAVSTIVEAVIAFDTNLEEIKSKMPNRPASGN
ncbi:MAG: M20/M25/M40 family metallo-hydrolase [candidate division KSB1 bacterium]|nr:M20/M25/M40 family metallo-hydrolase [candidate division KSB1 bacterium]MDZ7405100.1 M20/M25/M40 family metallo-hydrolase [candidate division KSB1 bacterium]